MLLKLLSIDSLWCTGEQVHAKKKKKSFEGRFSNIPPSVHARSRNTEEGSGSYSTDSVMWLTSHLSLLRLWLLTKKQPGLICHCQYWPTWIQYVQQWETLFKQILWHWITSKEIPSACVYCMLLFYTGNKPAQHNVFRRIYNLYEAGKQHLSFTYKVNCFLIGHAVIFIPQPTERLLNPEQNPFCWSFGFEQIIVFAYLTPQGWKEERKMEKKGSYINIIWTTVAKAQQNH